MKAKTIKCEIVKNCGNYESVRFAAEYELLPDEDERAALIDAHERLAKAYADMSAKKRVRFADPIVQTMCDAIGSGKYDDKEIRERLNAYTFDEDARKVLNLSLTTNGMQPL